MGAAVGDAVATIGGGGTSSEASDSEESGQSNLGTKPFTEGRSGGKRKSGKDKKSTDLEVPRRGARKSGGFRCCGKAPRDESADEAKISKAASDSKKKRKQLQ